MAIARNDSHRLLAASAVPIFAWSYIAFFHKLPSWLLHFEVNELISGFAYSQAFALLESLVVWGLLLLLARILSSRPFGLNPAAFACALALFGAFTMIVVIGFLLSYVDVSKIGTTATIIGTLLALALAVMIGAIAARSERLSDLIGVFSDRLMVLLWMFLPVAFASLLVVAARNL